MRPVPFPRQCRGFLRTKHTRLLHCVGTFATHAPTSAVVLDDGRLMAADEAGSKIIDLGTGAVSPRGHELPIAVCGNRVVTHAWKGHDEVLDVWRGSSRLARIRMPRSDGSAPTALLTPRHLVFLSRSDEVFVFDITTGQVVHHLTGHARDTRGRFSITAAPVDEGTRLLTCDGTSLRVWDLTTGKVTRAATVPADVEARDIVPSPREDIVVYTAVPRKKWTEGSTALRVARLDSLATVDAIKGHKGFVRAPLFLAGGELLVTAATDASIRIWTAKDLRLADTIDLSSGEDEALKLQALPGKWSFLASGQRGVLYVFGITWPERLDDVLRPPAKTKGIAAPAPRQARARTSRP